jgi:hypothetical protein
MTENSDDTRRTAGTAANASADARLTKILDDVAAGRMTPEQANALLVEGSAEPDTGMKGGEGETGTGTPTRIRLRAVGRRVRVIGEPFLTTLSVEGPHVLEQQGDSYLVTSDGELVPSLDKFQLRVPSVREVQERLIDLTRELVVRVNPKLPLELDITAGSLTVERVPRITSLEMTAGSAHVRDITGPIDVHLQGGSITLEGPVSRGDSLVKIEQGQLNLHLTDGASVQVILDNNLSRVIWNGESGGAATRVVGGGDASLKIESVMANVVVKEAA